MRLTVCLLLLAGTLGCVPILIGASITESTNERMAALLEETKGADPDHAGVIGLIIDKQGLVTGKVSGSPADLEAVKVGDQVLEVDGLPFTADMVPLSGTPDSQVRLLVLHKEAQREVLLKRIFWRSVMDGSWLPAPPPHEGP